MDAFLHSSQPIQPSTSVMTCPHCQMQFDSPESLSIHLRVHAPIIQGFPCQFCEKVYSTEGSLLAHQGTHTLMGGQQFGAQMFPSNMYGLRPPQTSAGGQITLQPNVSVYSSVQSYTSSANTFSQTGVVGGIDPPVIHTGLNTGSQYKDITQERIQPNDTREAFQAIARSNFETASTVNMERTQKTLHYQTNLPVTSESSCISSSLDVRLPQADQTMQFNVNTIRVTDTSTEIDITKPTQPLRSIPEISTDVASVQSVTCTNIAHTEQSNSQPPSEVTFTYHREDPNSVLSSALTVSIPAEKDNQVSQDVQNSVIISKKKSSRDVIQAGSKDSETGSDAIRTSPPCQNDTNVLIEEDSTSIFDQMQSPLVKSTSDNFEGELQNSDDRTKKDNVEKLEKSMKQHWASVEKQIIAPSASSEGVGAADKSDTEGTVVDGDHGIEENRITDGKGKIAEPKESVHEVDLKQVRENVAVKSDDTYKLNEEQEEMQKTEKENNTEHHLMNAIDLEGNQDRDSSTDLQPEDEVNMREELTCSSCNQEFQTHGGLKRHITRKHKKLSSKVKINDKKYTCAECEMNFNTRGELSQHKRTHKGSTRMQTRQSLQRKSILHHKSESEAESDSVDPGEKFLCDQCKKSFKNMRALNMHMVSHKKLRRGRLKTQGLGSKKEPPKEDDGDVHDNNLSCKECGKTFKTKKGLAYHLDNHKKLLAKSDEEEEEVVNISCDACNMSFQTKKDLSLHRRTHHKTETVKKIGRSRERSHICGICGKAFLERSHLREHEKRHGEADIPCQKCDKKFKFITDLRKHQRSHSDAKPFICTTCGNTFKAASHLAEHELRHGEAKFSCQYCGKKYHVEREMKKHEKIHTDKIYPCPHCAEEFREKPILQEHIREHEQSGTAIIKQFMCTHCNLYFSSQKGLLHHLNNKHRELLKPEERWQFTCEECNRVCPSQEALRHHKKLHKGDRVYPCSKCEKFFKSAQHLREHEKRHGEPTLSCTICNWKFVLAVDLRKHEKRHAMNKSLPCTHCDKKFSTNGALNAHIKRHTQSASSFVCTHCKLGFRSNLGLKYHLNHKHLEKLPPSDRWTHLCDHCNKVFPTKSSVLRHKNMQGKYSCQMCNLAFRTEKAYKLHQQIHLGLRKHCCPICKKGFKKAHHLAEHMKRHSEGKHPCRICGKKYVFLTDLRKHVKLSHLSPKLEPCTQCDKRFLSERMLRQHILLHHQAPVEKQYVCYDCNLQFSGSKGLMSHMNNKHRDKLTEKERWKFQCNICHRMFRSAKALEVHGQVHSNIRPHECKQCGKRFKEARHLLEHEKRHGEGQHPCPKCDKKYVFERDLVKHIRTHNEVKEFVCTECGKGFVKNSDLNAHLMRHEQAKKDPNLNKDKTLQCPCCTLKFVHKKGLDTHVNNKHREMLNESERWPFWCDQCKKAFRTKVAMKKHEPEHLGKRDFVCEVCKKRFKEARHLSEHQKRHETPTLQCKFCDKKYVFERDLQKHEKTHSEERPFKCPKCIRQYGLKSALETHMKQHEQTQAKYICQFCTLGFTSNLCLQNHLNNKHRDQLNPVDCWTHICKFCSKAYPTEQGLLKHERVHRNLKVHCCKICGKHFKLAHHLTQHEKRHQEGELECEYCQKKYVFASDLRKHVRIHTGEKPFCCEYCGKRFRVSGGLRKHLRLHDQSSLPGLARPHKCKQCKKSFRLKEKLTTHMKVHGEKQFTCTICNKKFCFEKTLQRHILTHSAIKPFACSLCSRQFVEEMALSRHLKKHENGLLKRSGLNGAQGKQYLCNYCTLYFATDYKKKYHMNKKHRDILDPALKWSHVCSHCNRPFATGRALQRHEATHTNQVIFQCLLCPKKFKTSQHFNEHEKSHLQEQQQQQQQPLQQQQQQQQIYVCKYCNKGFIDPLDLRHHENSHASDAIVTVPLQGDLTYNQDGLVQVSVRDTAFESTPNQQVSRTDGHFELLAELISATNNILTLNN